LRVDIAGCRKFSLMLRVPSPACLIDAEGAEVEHDFNSDGASYTQLTARMATFAEWLARQPAEAFVGPRGNNSKEFHLKVVLWILESEHKEEGDEVWGYLTVPAVLSAECARRELPLRVVVNGLY
jgi:hypothetical protein